MSQKKRLETVAYQKNIDVSKPMTKNKVNKMNTECNLLKHTEKNACIYLLLKYSKKRKRKPSSS